ncbi:MAG: serine acetyltransferase [Flavobacteriales bacterium]|nr:serine acetyltransferase [Flavobacteriales bacterium]
MSEESFIKALFEQHQKTGKCLSPEVVAKWLNELLGILYPERSTSKFEDLGDFEVHYDGLKSLLNDILCSCSEVNPEETVTRFFHQLPTIKEALDKDLEATFLGDPAAKTKQVVARSYPGFYAICAYRIANALDRMGTHLVPRALTEYAHTQTGIDIHPSATIGAYFCIDHGTGVVVGETTIIGNHVKLYQGVTLGALSVDKKDATSKRHPTIEDEVVIYAGATILGGNTVVGRGSVIGGNVWLTRSVPAGSKVYYSASMSDESGETDRITIKS